jgi:hypothetical protein
MSEAKNEVQPQRGGLERIVRRLRIAGTYSVIEVGEQYAVMKHGWFKDELVNLAAPHLTEQLTGGPYFNQALGTRCRADHIYKQLNGMNAYNT